MTIPDGPDCTRRRPARRRLIGEPALCWFTDDAPQPPIDTAPHPAMAEMFRETEGPFFEGPFFELPESDQTMLAGSARHAAEYRPLWSRADDEPGASGAATP